MRKTSLINVNLFGPCAAIWSIKAIYVIISKPYSKTQYDKSLHNMTEKMGYNNINRKITIDGDVKW